MTEKTTQTEGPAEPLNDAERAALAECENTIRNGRMAFQAVGQALIRIREARLYQSRDADFDGYCRRRWGWSKTHVNRLIAAAEVMAHLAPIGVTALPANEAQARALTVLTPEQQCEAWRRVLDRAGDRPITAALVQRVVREALPERASRKPRRLVLPSDPRAAAANLVERLAPGELDTFLEALDRLRGRAAAVARKAA